MIRYSLHRPVRLRTALAAGCLLAAVALLALAGCSRPAIAPAPRATTAAPAHVEPTAAPARVEPTAAPARVEPTAAPTRKPAATRTPSVKPTPGKAASGLPTIAFDRLPAEARETIRLIQRGGPFPYRQDGIVFQNREGLLPRKPSGYYHEYTVKTPGSADRGARRIVAGEQGELYYTDDHYASFKQVVMP